MPRTVMIFLAAAFAVATFASGSCARKPPRVRVYPVHGKLVVDGVPATRAIVYFHPNCPIPGANPLPFGVVEPDGTYRPATYVANDGLPVGEYRVTVVWPRYVAFDGQEIPSDDRLQGKYADPSRPVLTVTVGSKNNELPTVDLKS